MNKIKNAALALTSAASIAFTGVTASSAPLKSTPVTTAVAAVDDGNDDWLHAKGSRLYDLNGNEVWLTGANWFGLNCSEGAPHYLWSADCDDLLREVSDRGINVIRFPISTERIVNWMSGKSPRLSGGGMQASYNPPTDQDDGNGGIIKAGTYGSRISLRQTEKPSSMNSVPLMLSWASARSTASRLSSISTAHILIIPAITITSGTARPALLQRCG